MTIKERRDFLGVLQSEGWLGASIDDTPRFVAMSGGLRGWGYGREDAIRDLRAAMEEAA